MYRTLLCPLYLQLAWPWGSAPPASIQPPRKSPFPVGSLLLPLPMAPQEQPLSYCLGAGAQGRALQQDGGGGAVFSVQG